MTFRATGNGAAPKSPLAWPFQVKMCPQAIQIIEYSLKLPGISARLMERNWPLDLSLSAVLREQCIILTRIEKRECLWMGLTVYTWFLFILYYIYTTHAYLVPLTRGLLFELNHLHPLWMHRVQWSSLQAVKKNFTSLLIDSLVKYIKVSQKKNSMT